MLNIDEISKEIYNLENCNYTTFDVCKKLAILYTVREHYMGNKPTETINSPLKMSSSGI